MTRLIQILRHLTPLSLKPQTLIVMANNLVLKMTLTATKSQKMSFALTLTPIAISKHSTAIALTLTLIAIRSAAILFA